MARLGRAQRNVAILWRGSDPESLVELRGIGTLTASGINLTVSSGAAALSGIGTQTTSALALALGAATLAGSGTLDAFASVFPPPGETIVGAASIFAEGSLIAIGYIQLQVVGRNVRSGLVSGYGPARPRPHPRSW